MPSFKSLDKLGFSQKEQDVYLALLQLEKATANQIAYQSKVKRPTTYDILYRLVQEGFVAETEENGKHMFAANSPENILHIIEERKRELKEDLPQLLSIYNINAKKPKVAYFDGLDGIKLLFEDTLTSSKAGDEILAYVAEESISRLGSYNDDYVKRRAAKGILSRGIAHDTPLIRKFTDQNAEQKRTTRLVDPKIFPMKNEINIYASKIIIATYTPEPFGIQIESKEIADTQRSIFEMAWRGLSED